MMHPSSIKHPRIAFVGYSRVGKTTAALALRDIGYVRHSFGDIIKRQLDALLQTHLNISAFTEQDEQKRIIRPLLELWGDVNHDEVMKAYFAYLPKRCVNTRLVRVREAEEWKRQGGIVVHIQRHGVRAVSDWEGLALCELDHANVIDYRLYNDWGPEELGKRVVQLARGEL
jgi:hypothetical protein